MKTDSKMTVLFRFPVKQFNPYQVDIQVPRGPNGVAIIDPRFAEMYGLTDAEIEEAENRVIRAIAILPEGTTPLQLEEILTATGNNRWNDLVEAATPVNKAKL
jgi:hypothetical protein